MFKKPFIRVLLSSTLLNLALVGSVYANDFVTNADFIATLKYINNQSKVNAVFSEPTKDVLTREEAAYILKDMLHIQDKTEPFKDVIDNSRYAGAIGAVTELGLLDGFDAETFGYGQALTKKQLEELKSELPEYYKKLHSSYKPFKAAALQFNPEMYTLDKNIDNLAIEIETLFKSGVKLVVAPEMATTGYGYVSREDIAPYVDTLPGKATSIFAELAKKYDAYVVFGLAEVDAETGLYYNSAALVGPEGYIGSYRKMHQWETEEHWAAWGDIGVPVYSTALGNIVMNICMDASYFESARLGAVNGADIMAFVTNSSGGAVWALPARAQQNGMYIVSANRSNTELGYHMVGASAIWSPLGEKLVESAHLPTTVEDMNEHSAYIAEINPSLYSNPNKETLSERITDTYKEVSLYVAPWNYKKSTTSEHVNASALQYTPVTNIEKMKATIIKLMPKGQELVVLPELSLTGTDIKAPTQGNYAETLEFGKKLAKDFQTAIIIGAIEEEDSKLYNTSILIDKEGSLVGNYRKVHLSDFDKTWATAGDSFPVYTVEGLGKIGMLIGDDVRFPEAYGVLAVKRADIIAIPSAWYGQYGGFSEINKAVSANKIPDNSMVLWDAVSQNACAYTIVANFTGGSKNYLGSSSLNTIDPLYGLDQPVSASTTKEETLLVEFDTLQSEAWYNQEKAQQSRRTSYYNNLIF